MKITTKKFLKMIEKEVIIGENLPVYINNADVDVEVYREGDSYVINIDDYTWECDVDILGFAKEIYSPGEIVQMAIDAGYGGNITTTVYIDLDDLSLFVESFTGNTYTKRPKMYLYKIDQYRYKFDFDQDDLIDGDLELPAIKKYIEENDMEDCLATYLEIIDNEEICRNIGIDFVSLSKREENAFHYYAYVIKDFWKDLKNYHYELY